ncbi:hypothetical protein G6O69_12335 [Pseudenhygromyxa sp. WMMC2535]|uniref:YncE family protein n=1 Tax=Pseudenhygromyxa sp. WMMC2535 TaxID=2712867 RepID=UPI00159594BB|nr:hypothetical protein [Pseudenhygromyxa sp. WMMC2535]NVB38620.1 hypothetical protein [Pseudenhygromyxa sp. WMMC2535]
MSVVKPGFTFPLCLALAFSPLSTTACSDDGASDSGDEASSVGIDSDSGESSGSSDDESSSSDAGTSGTTTDGTADGADGQTTDDDIDDDDDDDDEGGVKFDLEPIGDAGYSVTGSCRASEAYGASGGFPVYDDPAFADFLDRKIAIVTHRAHSGGAPNVITIVDIDGDPPPPNQNYLAPLYYNSQWTEANLGKVFGLTLDSYGNMYVAPSTVYGSTANTNTIKRIDAETGEISDFVTLPNNGPAFGNINYDCVSESLYVANHEDGRIYQVNINNGEVISTYHHATGDVTMGAANDANEPNGTFAPLGERVWAVQSHAGRLYYSVWWEHSQTSNAEHNNEIWSVAYVDDDGVPDAATAKKEIDVPPVSNTSQPVSDISFAHDGWMLIAQRTMYGDMQTSAHQSTTFDYDYEDGVWVSQGTNYVVGELLPYSAAGGVDHDYTSDEDGYVWMTGDALDFYTPNVVYGLQGTPLGGGGIENSTLIDLDHEIVSQDKTVYGDVEVPIPSDVAPVPPPG